MIEDLGELSITVGLQVAQNLAIEIKGSNASEVLQALQDMSMGLEANLSKQAQREDAPPERKGLIIPEIVPSGPIREPK